MMIRATALMPAALMGAAAAADDAAAQRPHMHGQQADTVQHGMMGQQMMMGGMMGRGMMGPGMMQMMGTGMGMMATGGPGPAMLLRMGDHLELTEEQRDRLEQIQQEHSGAMQEQMHAAMEAHREAASLLDHEEPDFGAYERLLGEAADGMVRAHVAMARAAVEAREVLTPEQRDRLDAAMKMMGRMMGPGGDGS